MTSNPQESLFDLFPGEGNPRCVTFALAGPRPGYKPKNNMRQFGANLVFTAKHDDGDRLAKEAMESPLVQRAYGRPIWGTYGESKLVVGPLPVGRLSKSYSQHGIDKFYLMSPDGFFSWGIGSVASRCMRMEAVIGCCNMCEHMQGNSCAVELLRIAAQKDGVDISKYDNPEYVGDRMMPELFDYDDTVAYLRKFAREFGWTYISPGCLHSPGDAMPAQADEFNFSHDYAIRCRDEARDRAEFAAETRRWAARCKKECEIYNSCSWCETPYHGRPTRCWTESDLRGPFTEDEIHAVYAAFRRDQCALSDEQLSYLVACGGAETRIFGRTMRLRKANRNMRDVDFFLTTNKEVVTYSFEDAMTLLHTPYRDGGDYVYPVHPQKRERAWGAVLDEDRLDIYTEICRHEGLQSYSFYFSTDTACGFGFCDPQIAEVDMDYLGSVRIETHTGATRGPQDTFHVKELVGDRWNRFPSVVEEYGPKVLPEIRAAKAAEDPETSSGRRP